MYKTIPLLYFPKTHSALVYMYKQTTHHVAYIDYTNSGYGYGCCHVSIFMHRKTYVIRLMYMYSMYMYIVHYLIVFTKPS